MQCFNKWHNFAPSSRILTKWVRHITAIALLHLTILHSLDALEQDTPYIQDISGTSVTLLWADLDGENRTLCYIDYCQQDLEEPTCLQSHQICSVQGTFDSLDPGQLYIVYQKEYNQELQEVETLRTRKNRLIM